MNLKCYLTRVSTQQFISTYETSVLTMIIKKLIIEYICHNSTAIIRIGKDMENTVKYSQAVA